MKTKILIVLVALFVIAQPVSCEQWTTTEYDFDGNGLSEYPNNGWVIMEAYDKNTPWNNGANNIAYYGNMYGNTVNASICGIFTKEYITSPVGDSTQMIYKWYHAVGASTTVSIKGSCGEDTIYCGDSSSPHVLVQACANIATGSGGEGWAHCRVVGYFTTGVLSKYNVTGDTGCLDNVTLQMYFNNSYESVSIDDLADGEYELEIINGTSYRLLFSDGHTYDFVCDGDEVHDYSVCAYTTINLKDYCGNKMLNTSVDIYKSDGGAMATYEFVGNYHRINPIKLMVSDIGEGKMLDIYFDTNMGAYHQIAYCTEQTVDVLHPTKWWAIRFGAFDLETHEPIPNMKIHTNQSCKIDPDRLLNTYAFTGADGYALFTGLSGQTTHVRMDNDQYKGDHFWINSANDAFATYSTVDTYLNMSSGTDWYNNTDNMTTDCNIHFKDQSGHVDNHINDTDTYVDLYYDNGNCSATLKFQRLYTTYWMSKMTWNIPINESGYKRIYNVNFSDHDANYRGYMYATECDCNSTISLYVTNETVQEEQHYENLSTYIRFNHQMGSGRVDYRSPIEIKAYAYTNTSAYLLNINLTLYEQTTQIATVALDWADFAGASPKWYYVWQPTVSYDIGKNYTVVMTGYNGLNLGADDVWTSNIRNNKLTIYVKDNHNSPINYASIFIEGWGSQALGSLTDIEIEGFGNGNVQYKATKSGYTSSGWATVTLNDSDETVTCVLIKETSTRVTGYKLRNNEIKDFFIPVMYLLLMFMLVGAFFHTVGRR